MLPKIVGSKHNQAVITFPPKSVALKHILWETNNFKYGFLLLSASVFIDKKHPSLFAVLKMRSCLSLERTIGIGIISVVHNSSLRGSFPCKTPPLWFYHSCAWFQSSVFSQRHSVSKYRYKYLSFYKCAGNLRLQFWKHELKISTISAIWNTQTTCVWLLEQEGGWG